MSNCTKCGLELPADRTKYCVGKHHACWCDASLNQWRLANGIVTTEQLRAAFFGSIENHIVVK